MLGFANFFLKNIIPFFGIVLLYSCQIDSETTKTNQYEVVVIGGGTGGTAAGIQAARSGANTLIVEETRWLGGMLTAAGVSAIDGNHHMPAGIWGEFRQKLRNHYGGASALATGWVSHTLFEPSIGATIFQEMANAESNLSVWYNTVNGAIEKMDAGWKIEILRKDTTVTVYADVLIDGTDLGDVAAQINVPFDYGMDARSETGESIAPEQPNTIIQDFTYAAILKDFGEGVDKTIDRPKNYDSTQFFCSCLKLCDYEEGIHPCETMLTYGKLPNNKYMINWPIHGNDYYADLVAMPPSERIKVYQKAKDFTLGFVYFIQKELGYNHLGLADDEFPTEDLLPFIPYHREGRRIKGMVQVNVNHILKPFDPPNALYRTGIAVGDYPIDHHHDMNTEAPSIEFPPVPSFNIPIGALIPYSVKDFIVADKPISVTNIVNGSSRLQPVVLQIGQAAGALAALSAKENKHPDEIAIRDLQEHLLEHGGYLMPYYDVPPEDPHFSAIQKIGATGLLRGTGIPYLWANQTWFYPDTTINAKDFFGWLQSFEPSISKEKLETNDQGFLTINGALQVVQALSTHLKTKPIEDLPGFIQQNWENWALKAKFDLNRPVTKRELAVVLDQTINPFLLKPVDFNGNFVQIN